MLAKISMQHQKMCKPVVLPCNTNKLRPRTVVVDDAVVSGYWRSVTLPGCDGFITWINRFITWSSWSLPTVMGSLPGVIDSLPGVMVHYLEWQCCQGTVGQ